MELKEDTDNKSDKHIIINCVSYKESIERGLVDRKEANWGQVRSF